MKTMRAASAAIMVVLLGWPLPARALDFNLTFTSPLSAEADAALTRASQLWSSLLTDPVTINLTVSMSHLETRYLAVSTMAYKYVSYSEVYNRLSADNNSVDDTRAVSSLTTSSSFDLLINRTADNPYGYGSASVYLDNNGGANNHTIRMTTANAEALGIYDFSASDGNVAFNSNYLFDYDPSDGITSGRYDFEGLAVHEIAHQLGFYSGVDQLDAYAYPSGLAATADNFVRVATLDLFRYSQASAALGVIDWTADTRAKYLSVDQGETEIVGFSTGVDFGDGHQASHWKDFQNAGIMDPTLGAGELYVIGANDLLAMDVIGWDITPFSVSVPEPSSWQLLLFGLAAGHRVARYRSGRSSVF